jgi:hypothetical protein
MGFCCRIRRVQKKGPGVSDGAFGHSCYVLSARTQAKNPEAGFFNRNAFCGDEVHWTGKVRDGKAAVKPKNVNAVKSPSDNQSKRERSARCRYGANGGIRMPYPERSKTGVFARAYRDVFTAVPDKAFGSHHLEAVFDSRKAQPID